MTPDFSLSIIMVFCSSSTRQSVPKMSSRSASPLELVSSNAKPTWFRASVLRLTEDSLLDGLCNNWRMSTEICVWLSPEDRAQLESWLADRNTPKKLVWRWQQRYVAQGIAGLKRDASRPGRKPPLAPEVIAQVVDKTLHQKPPAATQWSTRTMARTVGLSQTSVRGIWHAHGLKPHLVRGFKL